MKSLLRTILPILLIAVLLSGCGSPTNEEQPKQNEISPVTENVPINEQSTEVQTTASSETVLNIDVALIQKTYEDMQNATDYLSLTNNGYTIKGYPISKDSVTKIGDQLVVNQGVIYEEIGAGIDLYCDYGLSQVLDEAFFMVLTGEGTEPENWDDLSKELYGFISADGTDKEIIAKLETLSCVNGTFDYEARKYEFEITDLEKAVEELAISEEMFGYILAKLSEYPSKIVFDGNSVSIALEVKTYG